MRPSCPRCHVQLRDAVAGYRVRCRQCGTVWEMLESGRLISVERKARADGERPTQPVPVRATS